MAIEQLLTTDGILDYPDADNPSKGTTEQQFQEWLKNQNNVLSDVVKSTIWQPNTSYSDGQIIGSPNMTPNVVAKVTTGGITASTEPAWGDVGESLNDGTVSYILVPQTITSASMDDITEGTDKYKAITPAVMAQLLKDIYKQAKLDAHPVGSIYESTSDQSPADLFGGTWEAMDPGRVLVSAGTTSTGTVYNAGDKGGEEATGLEIKNLPPHSFSGTTSDGGLHNHSGRFQWVGSSGSDKIPVYTSGDYDYTDSGTTSNHINYAGNHHHTFTTNTLGSGVAHNNMQPYEVVYRWKRTA